MRRFFLHLLPQVFDRVEIGRVRRQLLDGQASRQHLAVLVEPAYETLSPQMITKIETPAAREIYGQRLASVEPVFGHIRSPQRLDRFPWRGQSKVHMQWMLSCMVHHIEKSVQYGMAT